MNHDQIAGNWKQFCGIIREHWGMLMHIDVDIVAGRRDQLLGRIQQLRGSVRGASKKQLLQWTQRNASLRWGTARPR